ncbi:MAG: polysaccharide biosynthesis/export family protein [Verrucomicrobiales bacterium]
MSHDFLTRLALLFFLLPCALLAQQPASLVAEQPTGYVIKANDVLRLDIFNEPKVSVPESPVGKTGEASFPLIGNVALGGLTVSQASEKIRALYDADWLVDPKLTLTVVGYATEAVTVLGSVQRPGQLAINPTTGLDLATALAIAGGLSETADTERIELHRAAGGVTVYGKNDVSDGAAGKIKLASGDRIIVGQSRFVGTFVTVIGNVGKQGAVGFPVDGKLDLVTAIAAASGLTDIANPKKISVNRGGTVTEVDYTAISKNAAKPYMLQPGDIITVPQRFW